MAASRKLKRLVAQRKRAEITQGEIAERINARTGWRMTQPVLSVIEAGAFPAPAGFLQHYKEGLTR